MRLINYFVAYKLFHGIDLSRISDSDRYNFWVSIFAPNYSNKVIIGFALVLVK